MIEKIILDYLKEHLRVSAYMEEEPDMPEEYVLVEKTGSSGGTDHIRNATIVVQSYSGSILGAAQLNEEVKETMENIILLDDICKCSLNSDYNYTDTSRKKHRYQAVFDIVHY